MLSSRVTHAGQTLITIVIREAVDRALEISIPDIKVSKVLGCGAILAPLHEFVCSDETLVFGTPNFNMHGRRVSQRKQVCPIHAKAPVMLSVVGLALEEERKGIG